MSKIQIWKIKTRKGDRAVIYKDLLKKKTHTHIAKIHDFPNPGVFKKRIIIISFSLTQEAYINFISVKVAA